VHLHVGRVVELHGDPRTRGLCVQLVGPGDGPLHPELARRQLELGAVSLHQPATLDRERLGHAQDQPVPLYGADQGQADARIARSRLDYDRPRPDDAAALGVVDHGQGDAVLDAAPGLVLSCLAHTVTRGSKSRFRRTWGVPPIVSKMLS